MNKKPVNPLVFSEDGEENSKRDESNGMQKNFNNNVDDGSSKMKVIIEKKCIDEHGETKVSSNSVGEGMMLNNNIPKPTVPLIFHNKSERFSISNNGDLCFSNYGDIVPICNFIVYPIEEIIEDNGISVTSKYLIKGKVNGTSNLPKITITAKDFQNPDWIHIKWGLHCKLYATFESYKYVQEYISHQMTSAPKRYEYNYIGWSCIKGRHVYLHGRGAIGSHDSNLQGNKDFVIEINPNISEQEAYMQLLDMVNIANYNITIPLLGYTVLSVLNKPFQDAGFEPKFVMFLTGITGSRKTTLAKMFSNIFNRSTDFIPSSFKDTIAALELKAFEYKDSVLVVDDFHPTTSLTEKRHMETVATHLMRIYGDKMPKSRMNKYMQRQKEFKPQGLCLITGEDIVGGSSTTARYISLEIKNNDTNLKKLTEHQQQMSTFSTSLAYFLRWVSNGYQLKVKYIKGRYIELREEYQGCFSHGRTVEAFISLKIAFELLLEYGKHIQIDSNEKTIETIDNILWNVVSKHNESIITQDPAIMYLIVVKELIESGRARVIDKNKPLNKSENIIGYKDDFKLYLIPQVAYNEVKQFWKKLGKEFPLSLQKTNEALENLGVIETRNEGSKLVRTIKVSIGENRSRYLIIDINKMQEVLKDI